MDHLHFGYNTNWPKKHLDRPKSIFIWVHFNFRWHNITKNIFHSPLSSIHRVWPMRSFNKIEAHLKSGVTNLWSPSYPYNIGLASLHWIEVSTFNILTVGSSSIVKLQGPNIYRRTKHFFVHLKKIHNYTKTTAPTTKIIP